ncbi:hypothetical protein C8R48DRAFT_674221 [Suillus tomentosus]|nr:hypothetical protein C8R48DRAFT_674221 [Suillus tomentosus]
MSAQYPLVRNKLTSATGKRLCEENMIFDWSTVGTRLKLDARTTVLVTVSLKKIHRDSVAILEWGVRMTWLEVQEEFQILTPALYSNFDEGDDDAVLLSYRLTLKKRELCESSRPLNRQFAQRTFHYTFRVSSLPETPLHRASICGLRYYYYLSMWGKSNGVVHMKTAVLFIDERLAATRRKSSNLLVTLIACG